MEWEGTQPSQSGVYRVSYARSYMPGLSVGQVLSGTCEGVSSVDDASLPGLGLWISPDPTSQEWCRTYTQLGRAIPPDPRLGTRWQTVLDLGSVLTLQMTWCLSL